MRASASKSLGLAIVIAPLAVVGGFLGKRVGLGDLLLTAFQQYVAQLHLGFGASHAFGIRLGKSFQLLAGLFEQAVAGRGIGRLSRLLDERDAAVIGNLLAKLLGRQRTGSHAFEIVERQLVQPAIVEALEKFLRRLSGKEGRKLRTDGEERKQNCRPASGARRLRNVRRSSTVGEPSAP